MNNSQIINKLNMALSQKQKKVQIIKTGFTCKLCSVIYKEGYLIFYKIEKKTIILMFKYKKIVSSLKKLALCSAQRQNNKNIKSQYFWLQDINIKEVIVTTNYGIISWYKAKNFKLGGIPIYILYL